MVEIANARELRALITLAGRVDPSMQAAMMRAAGQTQKVNSAIKQTDKSARSMGAAIKASFTGSSMAIGASKIIGMVTSELKDGLKSASDLAEAQNVVDVTFGNSAQTVNKWAKTTLRGYGVSELQAKKYSGTLGSLITSSGVASDQALVMSRNMTQLAGDFASFHNLSTDEAFEKLKAGISGEAEPLKALGYNLSVANLEAFALKKGIKSSWSELDQATQTQLRYAYIMDVSSKAQGDFNRTREGGANQARLFQANIDKAATTIMDKALPALTTLAVKANGLMESGAIDQAIVSAGVAFENLGNVINLAGQAIKFTTDHANILIPVVGGLAAGIAVYQGLSFVSGVIAALGVAAGTSSIPVFLLTTATTAFGTAMAVVTSPIFLIAAGIAALVGVSIFLWKNWDMVSAKMTAGWSAIQNVFGVGIQWVIGKINGLIKTINLIPGVNIPLLGVEGQATVQAAAAKSSTSMPKMKMYANGGYADQASIFGEKGPEMAIPLKRTARNIGLLEKTAEILGVSGKSGGHTFHIHGVDTNNVADIKRAIMDILRELGEDEGRVSFG